MDIKSTKAYGKMKVFGIAHEFDYSDSGGIHFTVGQMMKDLFESPKGFRGEITIRLSPKPFTQTPDSEEMADALASLDITHESELPALEQVFANLWAVDSVWQLAMRLNYPANRDSTTYDQRVEAYDHYRHICSMSPGLRDEYPIHWLP
jgi:hypothetical protein